MKSSRRYVKLLAIAILLFFVTHQGLAQQRVVKPNPLLPEELIDLLINEVSGDIPFQNEILLSGVNRNRTAEEYEGTFYEADFILKKLKEYGIEEAAIEKFPPLFRTEHWDAESAELWMVEPEHRKLTCLEDIPACLATGSRTSDAIGELVYVGPGNNIRYYMGKDVKGKIVLATGSASGVHSIAVMKMGALGVVTSSSSHPEFDPDQVGWNSIGGFMPVEAEEGTQPTFAFVISARMNDMLRTRLERGETIVLHARCQTTTYPAHMDVVTALIPGKDFPEEELLFTAHLFEGPAKQGANDNKSGCVAILEAARVINKLVKEGKIPPPSRSIRFLWVEEIEGTIAYILRHPEIASRWFACINEDMVGESLRLNHSSFHLYRTPYSRPSFLNDVLEHFIEYVGETNRDTIINRPLGFTKPILSPNGTRDPFYYNIERYYGASDHIVLLDGGIGVPAAFLIAWPDLWYHSHKDTPDKSDPTQLKRVSFISAASALFMTTASDRQVLDLISECSSRALGRIGFDKKRALETLRYAEPEELYQAYKEAKNIVHQSYLQEVAALESVRFFIKGSKEIASYLDQVIRSLTSKEKFDQEDLQAHYAMQAAQKGAEMKRVTITDEEQRLAKLVPVRTEEMKGVFNIFAFGARLRGKELPPYRLSSDEEFEIRNLIDNKRNILDIRNIVSAEYRPIPLTDVENYIKVLEIGGMVTIEKKR
ncbi:hypothetical protein CEE39_08100 [bacterium (candidate division B38) B3_B38]|nr:MAG: hypothetical protein CEE39_08100 [bacterium (candidate division B38) B3_B38]